MSASIIGLLAVTASAVLDVFANIFLKKSQGFQHKGYGAAALLCIALAFLSLAYAIGFLELSIAYALFGAIGLLLTTVADVRLFRLRIRPLGAAGLFMTVAGIVVIQFIS